MKNDVSIKFDKWKKMSLRSESIQWINKMCGLNAKSLSQNVWVENIIVEIKKCLSRKTKT